MSTQPWQGQALEAEYIESGTFQAGEEAVYNAGIERGETVVIIKAEKNDTLMDLAHAVKRRLDQAKGRRNWKGLKLWERELLELANEATK